MKGTFPDLIGGILMPKVTREDIPNWFQKKTGFDVDIAELKKAAELDLIACAD